MAVLSNLRHQFLRNATCDEPVVFDCGGGSVVLFATPGPDKSVNEDCVAVIELPNGQSVFALADGVGGSARGDLASAIAVQAVLESTSESVGVGSRRVSILDAFEQAHYAVAELGVGASCTLVVAEVFEDQLRTYHTGDSGCLVTGQRGKIKYKTRFHSPVGFAEEAGLLDENEAITHSDRHFVSNVVGAPDMTVEVSLPFELAQKDTVVIGSDGLFDNAIVQEIADDVRIGQLSEGIERLIRRVSARMAGQDTRSISKPDDLSILLYRPASQLR